MLVSITLQGGGRAPPPIWGQKLAMPIGYASKSTFAGAVTDKDVWQRVVADWALADDTLLSEHEIIVVESYLQARVRAPILTMNDVPSPVRIPGKRHA
ncbi:MAG: hypothetical protein AAFO01_07105 [Pseudomonadota bacterium]